MRAREAGSVSTGRKWERLGWIWGPSRGIPVTHDHPLGDGRGSSLRYPTARPLQRPGPWCPCSRRPCPQKTRSSRESRGRQARSSRRCEVRLQEAGPPGPAGAEGTSVPSALAPCCHHFDSPFGNYFERQNKNQQVLSLSFLPHTCLLAAPAPAPRASESGSSTAATCLDPSRKNTLPPRASARALLSSLCVRGAQSPLPAKPSHTQL